MQKKKKKVELEMKICFPPRLWHGGPNERSLIDLYLNQPTIALDISALQICIFIFFICSLFSVSTKTNLCNLSFKDHQGVHHGEEGSAVISDTGLDAFEEFITNASGCCDQMCDFLPTFPAYSLLVYIVPVNYIQLY